MRVGVDGACCCLSLVAAICSLLCAVGLATPSGFCDSFSGVGLGVLLACAFSCVYPVMLTPCERASLVTLRTAVSNGVASFERGGRLPIVYHKSYNITAGGLEKLHPFDSTKYGRIIAALSSAGVLEEDETVAPGQLPTSALLAVHTRKYLASLRYSSVLTAILEVPVMCIPAFILDWRILRPMRRAALGTVIAAELARTVGWGINVGGGFHHAHRSGGGGFCVYSDIALAIAYLRDVGVRRVLYVDVDAHQGNGVGRDFVDDADVFILDCFRHGIYPGDTEAARGIRVALSYDVRDKGPVFLASLRTALGDAVASFRPEFVVYNAGTDSLDGDPLGGLLQSPQSIVERDTLVFRECLERRVPLVMVTSGGYTRQSAGVIADSIGALERNLGILSQCRHALSGGL